MNILPSTGREISLTALYVNLALIVFAMATPLKTSALPYLVSGLCIFVATAGLLYFEPPGAYHYPDVWSRQAQVMEKSEQRQPPLPEINKHTFLYYALIIEEHAETGQALLNAYRHACLKHPYGSAKLTQLLYGVSVTMRNMAENLRTAIAEVEPPTHQLPRNLAKPLFDGHLDTMVTVAGFGQAAGLPGVEGYEAVQVSNLSKANPVTGLIDKDPSGKWIKGVNYQPPNLDKVLDRQAQDFEMRACEEEYYRANT